LLFLRVLRVPFDKLRAGFVSRLFLAVRLYVFLLPAYGVFDSIPRLSKCRYSSRQAQASVAA